ncbi:MAG: hypothetical protein ABI645_06130 [Pseudomonadota bacterium]
MPVSRRLLLAFGALLCCGSASAAAVELLENCATQVAPKTTGIVALESACPGLESALRDTGLVGNLPDGWQENLNPRALGDLVELTNHYSSTSVETSLDPAALGAILHQLESERAQQKRSWWDAVKEWLRSRFGEPGAKPVPWLDRLMDGLAKSADLIGMIAYVLLALVVAGAIWVVVNELRMAGFLSRSKPSRARETNRESPSSTPTHESVDLDSAALADQPAILLRLLVARLLANGQLQTARNLTHRELVLRSAFSDAASGARFAAVAQLAERILYGAARADTLETGTVLAEGRSLLLQLQAVGGARQ